MKSGARCRIEAETNEIRGKKDEGAMNQCILMAEVVQAPQLRYTQDNQTAVAELMIQFPGLRPEDPATTMKAVGWGNLAQEIQERCQMGDRFVFEGRLRMSTVDRPEGFKEKQAELTISKVYSLSGEDPVARPASAPGPAVATTSSRPAPKPAAPSAPEPDYDDIPF